MPNYEAALGPYAKNLTTNIPKVVISLIMCKSCKLVQLDRNFNPKYLYDTNYGYRTGINATMTKHVNHVVKESIKIVKLKKKDAVLDIASNDGTLLNFYNKKEKVIKMIRQLLGRFFQSICYTLFIVTTLFINSSHATTWSEVADAGDLLNTAQIPTGIGSLDTITGTITTSYDVDLYKIKIINPTTFSATVFGGEGQNDWDSFLALFDQNGFGVYTNDADVFDDVNSKLPANHVSGPQTAGNYYLAIFDDDRAALSGSATSVNDIIFPLPTPPYTQIFGPTGPGGTLPLAGWGSLISEVNLNANYGINLTGAEFVSSVPIPAAVWFMGTGLLGLMSLYRKNKDQAVAA